MRKGSIRFAVLLLSATAQAAESAPTADQLIKSDHWKRARVLVEAALKQNANDAHALTQMAMIKQRLGDLDGAQKAAEQAIALDAKNAQAHLALADVLSDKTEKAGTFRQLGLARSVRRELDAAIAAEPNSVGAHHGAMLFLVEAPGIAGGDKKKAREEVATITKLDPLRGLLAQAEYERHEKSSDGGELYRKVHEAAGANYDLAAPYCNYLSSQGRWEEAQTCAAGLVKDAPDRVSGYTLLAIVHASQEHWKELDAAIADAQKNVPDNLNPEFQAARILIASGADNPRAERYLRHYLMQEPELGYPRLSGAHWRLGQVLEKQGRKQDAIAELETALRMEPDFKPIAADLKRLK
ncbi:MAG TPA: tetratricopeptide repeat protein [Candidatus Angelobacter sp.]